MRRRDGDRAASAISLSGRFDRPALSAAGDPVEAAVSYALYRAAEAGRFDLVAQLARELEARRLSRAGNVVVLDAKGRKRGL